jgi:hypothetical protein
MRNLLKDSKYAALFGEAVKDDGISVVLTTNSHRFDCYTPAQQEFALLLLKLGFLYAARDVRIDLMEWLDEDYDAPYRVDVVAYNADGEIVAAYETDGSWAFQLADALARLPEGEDYPELHYALRYRA